MTEIKEKAYAKLNLSLDITGRRDDGYHDMVMVMQTVSLADDITIIPAEEGKVYAVTDLTYIPGDERNLAVKAAKLYLSSIGREKVGLRIELKKHTPVGAGMGGGSADAAAVLRALDRMFNHALSREELIKLSGAVGSDVPFCLVGGTMLATGRGEILTPLPTLPDCVFVICKPDFSISTPEFFKKYDKLSRHSHPDTAGMLEALAHGSISQLCRRMYNVLEDVDDRRLKTVSEIKSALLDFNALSAMMTGTGSAVFGVFTDTNAAKTAADALKKEYGFACTAKPIDTLL